MGLFRKGKTHIIANSHRTDLVICSHSRDGKTLSYSGINKVISIFPYKAMWYILWSLNDYFLFKFNYLQLNMETARDTSQFVANSKIVN